MKLRLLATMALATSAMANAATTSLPAPQLVHFASLDNWRGEQPLALDGYLYQPPENASAPHAMVVMFHGCAGALTRDGRISGRFREMAQLLQQAGYGVLLVDSFTPRGAREICTTPPRQRTIFEKQRWLDAYGALAYLNARSDVAPGRIGAIGFSHGGSNALAVMDANLPPYRDSGKGFAASVAMYPGCYEVLRQRPQFKAYAPLLIQSGELDDWTPARYCRQLSERSQAHGEPVEFVSYADAYHGFDETTPVHVRRDVTHGVNGAAGVHVGGNPVAREQAYVRIREFFAAHLRP